MNRIAEAWRSSPHVRAFARAVVVAASTYLLGAIQQDTPLSLEALGFAVASAGLTWLVGFLTPAEPFIGPSYSQPRVEVPVPPADPEPAK